MPEIARMSSSPRTSFGRLMNSAALRQTSSTAMPENERMGSSLRSSFGRLMNSAALRQTSSTAMPENARMSSSLRSSFGWLMNSATLRQTSSTAMPENARMGSSIRTSFGRLMNSATLRQTSSTARAICTYFSSQLNATVVSIKSSIFYFTRGRSVSRFNQTTGYMIATLLVFLQLKYLTNDNKTPFTTHPHTMGVAVFSAFMYYMACSVHLQHSFRQFSVSSHNCMVWFGDISVASLMSMFMPDWARPLLYLVFGLIWASGFLQKLFVEETGGPFWVQRRRLRRFWNDLGGLCSLERAHILPR